MMMKPVKPETQSVITPHKVLRASNGNGTNTSGSVRRKKKKKTKILMRSLVERTRDGEHPSLAKSRVMRKIRKATDILAFLGLGLQRRIQRMNGTGVNESGCRTWKNVMLLQNVLNARTKRRLAISSSDQIRRCGLGLWILLS